MADKRALKILFDTYWSSSGWKSAGNLTWAPQTPPEDLAYAIRLGLMFPPQKLRHDSVLERLGELRARITPRSVGDAFVATLSSGAPALRSALGSYAVALHMPVHRYSPRAGDSQCGICRGNDLSREHDLNVLSFERHRWGGVRHEDPLYIAFDLDRFDTEADLQPTATDSAKLVALLRCCETMAPSAKLGELVSATSHILGGNKDQRRTVISILGFAGVLRIPDRSGFFRSFTPAGSREETPWHKDDWPYPIRWWRGGQGVDAEAVAFWFGQEWPAA